MLTLSTVELCQFHLPSDILPLIQPPIQKIHLPDPPRQPSFSAPSCHPPGPVAARVAGVIHPRLVPQAQEILHRRQRKDRHRSPAGPDQVPGHIVPRARQVAPVESLFFFSDPRIPAASRVVIVRAGVDHAVHRVVVRQEGVFRVAAESKLQNLHPGQAERSRAASPHPA